MTQFTDSKQWQRSDEEYDVMAIILAVIASLLVFFTVRRYGIFLSFLVFPIVLFSIIEIQRRLELKTWKIVFTTKEVAIQVVENVLQDKGIPYQQADDQFELEGSNLTIHMQNFVDNRSRLKGSLIILKPLTPDNMPLINRLQQKIDEAFSPKGL